MKDAIFAQWQPEARIQAKRFTEALLLGNVRIRQHDGMPDQTEHVQTVLTDGKYQLRQLLEQVPELGVRLIQFTVFVTASGYPGEVVRLADLTIAAQPSAADRLMLVLYLFNQQFRWHIYPALNGWYELVPQSD